MGILKTMKEYHSLINNNIFLNELLCASENIAVLKSKIEDSKLKKFIYLPLLQRREAMESLKIEGTQTTMSDIISDNVFPNNKEESIAEVRNYTEALCKGCNAVKFGFDHMLIKNTHKILLSGKAMKRKSIVLGDYRKIQNTINRNNIVVYTPPTADKVEFYMNDLLDFIINDSNYNDLVKAALFHSQFESIHPFDDGNGRVGRILIPIYLFYKEKINAPLFYISEAFNEDKVRYYKMLTESRTGDINLWIKYFLDKCSKQANKHIDFVNNVNALYDKTIDSVQKNLNTSMVNKIVDAIFEFPQISAKKLSEKIGVSMTQSIRYLNTLVESKILETDEQKRNKSYYLYELIELLSS